MLKTNYPLVSIVTPSYNQGGFIEDTIRSVLAQDYPNIEYIVVDGASTDSTSSILCKYIDKITCSISEPDTGQANAINKGIRFSHGEFIGWLNSDDILYSDTVSAVVKAFASNPGSEVVYGNVDCGASISQVSHTIYGRSFDFVHSFRRLAIPIPQQGCFWRRSALIKCGLLNEEWQFVLDRDYFIRLADRCSLIYINKTMGLFRLHPNSKSVLMNVGWSSELILLYTSYFSSSQFCHPIIQFKTEIIAGAYMSAALLAFKSCNMHLFFRYLLTAFMTDPFLLVRPFFLSRIGLMG